ncbi:saccharopine dehydrogenase-like oxidoreductase isoform X2 [Macrobrachium rosenbergii]
MASLAPGLRYDLVIFGATGFTGQYVVEEVARVAQKEEATKVPLTWAVAGRSSNKLQETLATAQKETGLDLKDVGLILADVSDKESLNKMAAQSSVVVNCVGPYQLYGEQVVSACIDNGASHVDISGEPQFLEGMQLKYNEAAEAAGVHIVGACGYDSIPAEMGLVHMIKNFKGELNSAQLFVTTRGGNSKTPIHTGTMESAALAIANNSEIAKIRRQLFPKPLPKPKHKVSKKGMLHKNEAVNLWGVAFPTDEPVVYRTQRHRHDVLGQRPVQFQQFLGFRSAFTAIGLIFGMAYFAVICYFSWTRKLLLKYPEIMTAGAFRRAGADREALKNLRFTSTIIGQGWSETLLSGSDQHSEAPDSSITVKISGPDPGYGATSLMMVACAMTILREKQMCAGRGGVMTPGVAFAETSLIDRIVDRGMTVSVEQ